MADDAITAFVVSLGLDPTDYNREMKKYRDDRKRLSEEDAKYNRQSNDGQKRQVEAMRSLRNETAGFLLTLAGASSVTTFFTDMVKGAAETGRLAQNLGIATERVGAWEAAIKRAGGTAESAQGALRLMSSLYQQNKLGVLDPGTQGDLMGLGVSQISQDPEENLFAISRAATRMDRQQFIARASRLGLDQGTINVLAEGPDKLRATLAEMEKLSAVTEEQAEEARQLEKAWLDLQDTLKMALRPAITEAVTELTAFTKGVLKFADALKGWEFRDPWEVLKEAFANSGFGGGDEKRKEGVVFTDRPKPWYERLWDTVTRKTGNGGAGNPSVPNAGSGAARGSRDGNPARNPRGTRAVALDGNNPGGLNDGDFARRQPGYVGNNGRYAAFRTMADGIAAQRALLASYVQRGYNTPLKIARRWAPVGDGNNSDRYARQIAAQMGIGVNDRIGAAQLNAFQHAQAVAENGRYVRAAGGKGFAGASRAASSTSSQTTQSSTQTTNVGTIVINTEGKNADQIARDMRVALAKRGLTTQANTGLQP